MEISCWGFLRQLVKKYNYCIQICHIQGQASGLTHLLGLSVWLVFVSVSGGSSLPVQCCSTFVQVIISLYSFNAMFRQARVVGAPLVSVPKAGFHVHSVLVALYVHNFSPDGESTRFGFHNRLGRSRQIVSSVAGTLGRRFLRACVRKSSLRKRGNFFRYSISSGRGGRAFITQKWETRVVTLEEEETSCAISVTSGEVCHGELSMRG